MVRAAYSWNDFWSSTKVACVSNICVNTVKKLDPTVHMSDILSESKAKISQTLIVLGIFSPNSSWFNYYLVCFFATIEVLDVCVGTFALTFCICAGGIEIFTFCAICYLAPGFVPLVPEGCTV